MARVRKTSVGFRLPVADLQRLKTVAGWKHTTVSALIRDAVASMMRVEDPTNDDLAEAVMRVARQRQSEAARVGPQIVARPVRGGLFRLGEDSRIRHLDEGSPLEGMDIEGSG